MRTDGTVARLVPMAFGGHGLYCRKLKMGEPDTERHLRRFGEIVVPARSLDSAGDFKFVVMEVRAKGPRVGRPCSKEHARLHNRCRCMADCYNVGDIILMPYYSSEGGRSSPFADDEYFVEESVPLAVLAPE